MKAMMTTTLLAAVSLLAAASPVAAQLDLVGTYLQVEAPEPLTDWDGSTASGTVSVELCSDEEGGFNPAGGTVIVTAFVGGPSWIEASVSPESIELSPGTGPEPEPPGCMDSGSFTVSARADEVRYATSDSVFVDLEAGGAEGDEELPVSTEGMGTYAMPASQSTSMALATIAPPPDDDDDDDGNGAGGGTGRTGPANTNESPGPALAVSLLVLAAIVSLRRRRDR